MSGAFWVAAGSILGFLGVALGAFGAHGLRERLEPRALEIYQTAAHYELIHAVVLVALGCWMTAQPNLPTSAQWSGWSFLLGVLIFSGSLYALALSDIKVLGAITPIGGLLFLMGWAALAWTALKS